MRATCWALVLTACSGALAPRDAATATDAHAADASGPGDAALDAGGGSDAAPPCADPPGSACNPIVITSLPFSHHGDTSISQESLRAAYACAPSTDEGGPELHYELVLTEPMRASFAIAKGSGVGVDVHVLRSADPASCIARANTTLEQGLGAGRWRVIVDTYQDRVGAYTLTVDAVAPQPAALGEMWNTYYYVADEDDYTGAQDVPIFDSSCDEIARVRRGFHDSVCIEGTGRLADDRLINVSSACTSSCPAAQLCGSQSYRICYSVPDPARYPWGVGAGGRALEVDRSMAVDPAFVALGSVVYLEELAGSVRPGGSEPHDGCMRADDVGGAIDGNHFDFFAGTRARWLQWEDSLPTRSTFHAWLDDPRCYPRP